MRVWIATDWDGTKVYTTQPKLINNGNGSYEWYGYRCAELENLLPKGFKQDKNKCKEAIIELIL